MSDDWATKLKNKAKQKLKRIKIEGQTLINKGLDTVDTIKYDATHPLSVIKTTTIEDVLNGKPPKVTYERGGYPTNPNLLIDPTGHRSVSGENDRPGLKLRVPKQSAASSPRPTTSTYRDPNYRSQGSVGQSARSQAARKGWQTRRANSAGSSGLGSGRKGK